MSRPAPKGRNRIQIQRLAYRPKAARSRRLFCGGGRLVRHERSECLLKNMKSNAEPDAIATEGGAPSAARPAVSPERGVNHFCFSIKMWVAFSPATLRAT
jgi:hypothetical protein